MFKKLFHLFSYRYLSYSKSELRGTIILLILLTVQVLFLYFTRNFDTGKSESRIKVIELPLDEAAFPAKASAANKQDPGDTSILAEFDPNTADLSTLTTLGLSKQIAERIIKYRRNGGTFLKPDDLLRIYGLDSKAYDRLEPYIRISEAPDRKADRYKKEEQVRERSFRTIELNRADSAELERLPLIGPKRASMIVKYRSILRGFVNKVQLLEVYSIDSSVYQVIMDRVTVDPGLVQPLRINFIHSDSLYHPYLSRKQASMIMNYRNNHGKFTDPETVCEAALLNDKLCTKIAPYFSLD